MEKETTTIEVDVKTHKKLMWFKIQSKAKNLDFVIKDLIKRSKQ